jgi:hypothetical protein
LIFPVIIALVVIDQPLVVKPLPAKPAFPAAEIPVILAPPAAKPAENI